MTQGEGMHRELISDNSRHLQKYLKEAWSALSVLITHRKQAD